MKIHRETILSSARDLCLDEGLEGFSMRKLASHVGVTAPALYRHYEGKEEVILDVVSEAYRIQMEYLSRALAASTAEERFSGAGEAYMEFALQNPRLYELLYNYADVLGLASIPEETAARARAVGQFWQDRVREMMGAGLLKEGDPDQVSATFWALAHGIITLYVQGVLPLDEDGVRAFAWVVFARVLDGLATEGYAEKVRDEVEDSGLSDALAGAFDPEHLTGPLAARNSSEAAPVGGTDMPEAAADD